MTYTVTNTGVDRTNYDSGNLTHLSVEDMIVLVGIQSMQFQQGKIQGQYDHISEQQGLIKNLSRAMNAAAHTKEGRLDKIFFDYTDPLTGKTTKMDLKTFMDRFHIDSPKPEYHGIVKFIKDIIDGIGKLFGKIYDVFKAKFPELAGKIEGAFNWLMDKANAILTSLEKGADEFMKTDIGKAIQLLAVPVIGFICTVSLVALLLPVIGSAAAAGIAVAGALASAGLMGLSAIKVESGEWDLYKAAKELIGGVFNFLKENWEEIIKNYTETLTPEQWKEVEQNLKQMSDLSGSASQQEQLRLSNALNEYNELTQMFSNNLNKVNQMNLAIIGNMR